MDKKFYKSQITLTVISDEPTKELGFEQISQQILGGKWAGQITNREEQEISGQEVIAACKEQDCDADLFHLHENGEEVKREGLEEPAEKYAYDPHHDVKR